MPFSNPPHLTSYVPANHHLTPQFHTNKTSILTPQQNVTAITRPSSTPKPALLAFQKRGVRLLPADLTGNTPDEDLAKLLVGIDIIIATINIPDLQVQIPLANAAKIAGVKRFVPCFFGTIVPPGGLLGIRDMVIMPFSRLTIFAVQRVPPCTR